MKYVVLDVAANEKCLPPCGGSGLKCIGQLYDVMTDTSPSMRREWIEIAGCRYHRSGVKSPSMRREWIEIPRWSGGIHQRDGVSLHAEGVD